jgi:hypothetical protein
MGINIRICTAITIITICVFALVRGFGIVQFSRVKMEVGSAENGAERMQSWATVAGLGAAALQSQLAPSIDPSDLKAAISRREALAAILSVKPMSSNDWLSLSGIQLMTDQPMEQVLGSLMLSMMTGPNEGYTMTERAMFGVSLWEDLSPDLRRHVINDLAAGEIPESSKIRDVFAGKSAAVSNELRTSLLATGLSPKQVDRRLGL